MILHSLALAALVAGSVSVAPAPSKPLELAAEQPGPTIVVKGGAVGPEILLEQARKMCASGEARLVETTPREDDRLAYRFACLVRAG
jgi:hypothetical protein